MVGMLVFRGAVVRGPAFVVRLFCRVLLLRVLRATLRRPDDPLPQVHPDKWCPSVRAWRLREGRLGKLGRTSGRRQRISLSFSFLRVNGAAVN